MLRSTLLVLSSKKLYLTIFHEDALTIVEAITSMEKHAKIHFTCIVFKEVVLDNFS